MINLLPPDNKRQIYAAQSNVLLLRYCLASLALAALLAGIIGIAYLTLNNSKVAAEESIRDSEARSSQYTDIKVRADRFKNNLATAKAILDKEVRYTAIALQIAQTIPEGIVLQSLQLNAQSFGETTVLDARGKTYDDAIRLKSAFEGSEYFKDIHLLSVSYASEEGSDSQYPISIQISVIVDQEIMNL